MSSPHPDSKWTHSICAVDYELLQPGRDPLKGVNLGTEVCCWCGQDTDDGIYYRADPKLVHPE